MAIEKIKRVERRVVIVPPRKSHDPLCANRAERLKQTKMIEVPKNAVTTMLGSMSITRESTGPKPRPVQKANPSKNESLRSVFFPLSRVQWRARIKAIEAMTLKKPEERMLV